MHSTLQKIIQSHDNICLLTGAGVSVDSNIMPFRGPNGLYNALYKGVNPQDILSRYYFNTNKSLFWNYINEFISIEAVPNDAHYFAKFLDDIGKLTAVITQNIDGLYQKTGLDSDKIIEIHGHNRYLTCFKCKKNSDYEDCIVSKSGNYLCPHDEFQMNTNIILYGDNFSRDAIHAYYSILEKSDAIIVMGTSLDITFHKNSVLNFHGSIYLLNDSDIALYGNGKTRLWDDKLLQSFNKTFANFNRSDYNDYI